MKTSTLMNGRCVSCGRRAGRRDRVCPYCGEEVWRPRWWRAGRWCALLLPPVLLACLAGAVRPDWATAARRILDASPLCVFLFAAGVGLLLLPAEDGDLVAGSSAELRRRQAQALLGGWAMALYAVAGAMALAGSPEWGSGVCLLAAGLFASAAATPFFIRVPWRSLAAASLLAAAVAGSR
jgi:hypothetical protein